MKTAIFVILVAIATGVAANEVKDEANTDKFTRALKITFGMSIWPGSNFHTVPVTIEEAKNTEGWVETDRPEGPKEYKELIMYCYDHTVCPMYDLANKQIAALLIAFQKNRVTKTTYDLTTNGFSTWVTEIDGEPVELWYITQYYLSPETMLKSHEERKASYREDKIIQNGYIYTTGFNGEVMKTAAGGDELVNNSNFFEQGCIPLMGKHYYYNMTEDMGVSATDIYPWFFLTDGNRNELAGSAMMFMGQLEPLEGKRDWFEHPASAAIKLICTHASKGFLDLADKCGATTMHIYYIDTPRLLWCMP